MSPNRPVMVVEDDVVLQEQLAWSLGGHELLQATDRSQAVELALKHEPRVVLLDLGLPPDPVGVDEGFATLDALLDIDRRTKVIVLTGRDDREHARMAIRAGAHDFCSKPMEPELIDFTIRRAMHVADLEREVRHRDANTANSMLLPTMIGQSPAIQKLGKIVKRVAPTDISVLIAGESGTGKELVAKALHQFSERADRKFIAINCAAIPENLLEAELFGFEKGAFTGAHRSTAGKFELASGGTLFLDEIGDLPLALQAKLLRFLQERVVERLGGRSEIEVDVRVVCATHRDVDQLVEAGDFRQDLYFRLAGITIDLPPLRDRYGDPPLLAKFFLDTYAKELSKNITGFDRGAISAIDAYGWPGNIRELQNRVKRAVVLADGKTVTSEDLDLNRDTLEEIELNLRRARQKTEYDVVQRALARAQGNMSQTARLLGVSRPTLYDLLKDFELKAF